jgi:peptidoglycan hydrolase-like protein with peptidoglycan-binding domain
MQELVGLLSRRTGDDREDPLWDFFGVTWGTVEGEGIDVAVYRGHHDVFRATLEARAQLDRDYGHPSEFAVPVPDHNDLRMVKPLQPGEAPREVVLGDGGVDVRIIQLKLGPVQVGKVDGWYGPFTEAAVRRYQERHGLNVTGKVGRRTRDRLQGITRGPRGANRAPAFGHPDEAWTRQTLRMAGYGPIDDSKPEEGYATWVPPIWLDQYNRLTVAGAKQAHAQAIARGAYPSPFEPGTLRSVDPE